MTLVFGHGIPIDYLLCGHQVNPHGVEESIEPLVKCSLKSEYAEGSTFIIHRLIQLWVRQWLQANNNLPQQTGLALKVLYHRFLSAGTENWRICELLMPHVEIVLNYTYTNLKFFERLSQLLTGAVGYFNLRKLDGGP